ncbi:MAG: DNRLRE domain-containing protein, partial [Chloroflexota bacterium]
TTVADQYAKTTTADQYARATTADQHAFAANGDQHAKAANADQYTCPSNGDQYACAAPADQYAAPADLYGDGGTAPADPIAIAVARFPGGRRGTEAAITLTVFNPSLTTYQFYEARRPWLEDEIAWNSARSGDEWQVPRVEGAEDRDATSLGELAPAENGSYVVELNADALAVVQGWVDDPDSNHGFVITGATSNDGVDFRCSEYESILERPLLTITYVSSGE